jgi:hypothetical protein
MSTGFEGALFTEFLDAPVDKTKWFRTEYDFAYVALNGTRYVIPEGTYTDFASIPRGFRWLISRVGKYGKAAVAHDYWCKHKIIPRKEADRLFLEAMKRLGVWKWRRWSMWAGVAGYTFFSRKK